MKSVFLLAFVVIMAACATKAPQSLEVGAVIHGFTLKQVTPVSEIDGTAFLFEHNKTKSPLLYLANSDDNKTFTISFKTPPQDDTGVFHIFEHAVLAGSQKFPSKSLFFEVMSSSVNTFQNAMTAKDKTFYPVASTNSQDFKNLVEIYLDSVFFPEVLRNSKIFEREGWRHEITSDGKIAYNGVVFSEMKGAEAGAMGHLWGESIKSVFAKDSAYHFDSGGKVLSIPDLSYEQLVDTHKRYYNPANSQIIFYGNGVIADHLKIVNDDYFSKIEPNHVQVEIPMGSPPPAKRVMTKPYPASETERDLSNKVMHTRVLRINALLSPKDHYGLEVLIGAITAFESSPLKRSLIGKKICNQTFARLLSYQNPLLIFGCLGSSTNKQKAFDREIDQVLKSVAQNGLPQELLLASLNANEFQAREDSTIHRGLTLSTTVLDSWLYGADPLAYVRYEAAFAWLRNERPADWAQQLTNRLIIQSPHQSLNTFIPDKNMLKNLDRALAEKLKNTESTMGREAIAKNFAAFKAWNDAPVPKEIQNKAPKLSVRDLERKQWQIPQAVTEHQGVKILSHESPSRGIVYTSLYFDVNSIPEEWVRYLPLLAASIAKVDTKSVPYDQLNLKVYQVSGDLRASVNVFPAKGNPNSFDARFIISTKALNSSLSESYQILKTVLLESEFSSAARIAEIFREQYNGREIAMSNRANRLAALNASAKISSSGRYNNELDGVPQIFFLREQAKLANFVEIAKKLHEIGQAILQKSNLVVAVGYDPGAKDAVFSQLLPLVSSLPVKALSQSKPNFSNQLNFEAASLAGQVQFVVLASLAKPIAENYGAWVSVSNLTTSLHLFPKLREQGGAYGGGMSVAPTGEVSYQTFRDPRLDGSVADFKQVPAFLSNLPPDQSLVDNSILKTIGQMDLPLTAAEKLMRATSRYLSKITNQDLQNYRDQVFKLNVPTIRKMAKDLATANENAQLSVLGYKPILEASPLLKSKKIIDL